MDRLTIHRRRSSPNGSTGLVRHRLGDAGRSIWRWDADGMPSFSLAPDTGSSG
jgi:hypothetical protein